MTELQVKKIGKAYEVSLDERPIRVGRASSNDIVLRSDRVSREHCVIEIVDGTPRLRDLESRYGTRVNGKKVKEAPIRPGDRIGVGGYEIAFDGLMTDRDATDGAVPDRADPKHDDEDAAERARVLDERQQTLDEREQAIAEREQTLAARETDLENRDRELNEARVATDGEREELSAREAAHEADLERREQELAAERETLTAENRALTERDTERAREIERMTGDTGAATAAANEERSRAGKLADELASLQTVLEAAHRETRSVSGRLSETETDNDSIRKQAAHLSRQLERKSKDLTKTIDRAAALETALAQAQAARQVLAAQAGKAQALDAAGRAVVAASDYLALVRQSVLGIETQWIETDEIVNDSQEAGQVDAFQAMQREELSRQLEYAHEERDAAMTDLQEAVSHLSDAIRIGHGTPAGQRRLLNR